MRFPLPDDWRERLAAVPDNSGLPAVLAAMGEKELRVAYWRGHDKEFDEAVKTKLRLKPAAPPPPKPVVVKVVDPMEELHNIIVTSQDRKEAEALDAISTALHEQFDDLRREIIRLKRELNQAKVDFAERIRLRNLTTD